MSNVIGVITVIASAVVGGVLAWSVSKQHQRKEHKQYEEAERRLGTQLQQERLQREQIERQYTEEHQQRQELEHRLQTQLEQERQQHQELEHRLQAQLEQERQQHQELERQYTQEHQHRQEVEHRLQTQLEQERQQREQIERQHQEEHQQRQEAEHRLQTQLEQERQQRQEAEHRLQTQLEQERQQRQEAERQRTEEHQQRQEVKYCLQTQLQRLKVQLEQERQQRQEAERQYTEEHQQRQEWESLKDDLTAPQKPSGESVTDELKCSVDDLENSLINFFGTLPSPSSQRTPDFASKLYEFLESGKWEEADKETLKIMLKQAGREKEGWLDMASIQNFPSEDLRTIDQLWVKSSNGNFGFSVQKRIWESVGGNLDADDKIRQAFGDRVGWRVNKNWLQVDDFNFKASAPVGHLPAVAVRLGGLSWGVDSFWWEKRKAYEFLLSQKDW